MPPHSRKPPHSALFIESSSVFAYYPHDPPDRGRPRRMGLVASAKRAVGAFGSENATERLNHLSDNMQFSANPHVIACTPGMRP